MMTPDLPLATTIGALATAAMVAQAQDLSTMPGIQTAGIVGVILIVFKFMSDQSKAHREERRIDRSDREKDREILMLLRASIDAQTRSFDAHTVAVEAQTKQSAELRSAIRDLHSQIPRL